MTEKVVQILFAHEVTHDIANQNKVRWDPIRSSWLSFLKEVFCASKKLL